MLPALDNFIHFGAPQLIQNPDYIEAIIEMISIIFDDKNIGGVDKICGCKLAECCMLNLRGHIDEHVGEFIHHGANTLSNSVIKVKSLRVHMLEMIINALYYNAPLALSILEMNSMSNKFFTLWFQNLDNMTRVHDKKLSIVAITALLNIPPDQVPQGLQQSWPGLLHGLVKLYQTLPAALKSTFLNPVVVISSNSHSRS